jgi:hypothetical protein
VLNDCFPPIIIERDSLVRFPPLVETVLTRLAALFLTGAAGDITAASLKRAEARSPRKPTP